MRCCAGNEMCHELGQTVRPYNGDLDHFREDLLPYISPRSCREEKV